MKRIDDKIKEIEKKDKQNRWAYYIILVMLVGFLFYASTTRKSLNEKDETIAQQLEQIEDQLKVEKALTKQLDDSIKELNRSLKPDEYWSHTRDENTVEGYIAFLTNDWGIDKSEHITKAYNRLLDDDNSTKAVGYDGWLFVGLKNNAGEYTSGNSDGEKTIEIIYRHGSEGNIANSEPLAGDIVRLVDTKNRLTYKSKENVNSNRTRHKNEQGFRNKTKAVVVDTYEDPNNINFYVRIKYY